MSAFCSYQAIANNSVPAYQQKMQDTKNSYAAKRQVIIFFQCSK